MAEFTILSETYLRRECLRLAEQAEKAAEFYERMASDEPGVTLRLVFPPKESAEERWKHFWKMFFEVRDRVEGRKSKEGK